jgi:hypothetical protein
MKKIILSIVILLLITACADKTKVEQVSPINQETTQSVLDHHMKTFLGNDLEGIMADYTEESVLVTPNNTLKGITEIRDNFARVFTMLPKDSISFKMNKSLVVKDLAYIIWECDAPKIKFVYGSDSFIVQNGKIIRQTFAGVVTPK